MAPRNRRRVYSDAPILGFGTWGGNPIQSSYIPRSGQIDDVTGNKGGVNPLTSYKFTREGGLLTGNSGGFIPNGMPVHNDTPGKLGAPTINQTNYGNRVLSQSGPLTPNLYLPVSVFELRDIPRMLRHAGNLLHGISRPSGLNPVKEAAAANVAYQFGWGPLIEDIGKMLDFSDAVKKRQMMLARAHSSKGVRRRVILDSGHDSREGQTTVWSTYTLLADQKYVQTRQYKRWATVTWTVKDKSQIGRIPTFTEGFRTMTGTNAGHIPIAIWKALPWTWAVDWFTDISNVLQANYNMIYYQPSRACIMTHSKSQRHYRHFRTSSGKFEISSSYITQEWKERQPFSPTARATMKLPFLDSFKLSIVGSLTILAFGRR